MSRPIESYGMIGDCETAALVGSDGSIDWLCWPRFDSDSTFAALLGDADNGRWLIGPAAGGDAVGRRYRGDTLILETDFEDGDGNAVTLIDFMPPRGTNSDIVRVVRGRRGRMKMRMELVIRFGYGRIVPWVRRVQGVGDKALLAVGGPDMVVLRTPVETRGVDTRTVAEFEVGAGEDVPFVFTYGPSYRAVPEPIDVPQVLADTESYWTEWAARSRGQLNLDWRLGHRAEDAAVRSLITLKALTYAPTGGIVAAPTTTLPALVGGGRNWDYRFCWLRDATLTLISLMDAGYYDEAQAWRDWLLRAVAGNPEQIQIMYGIAGERRLSEWSIPWLKGFAGSKPVRIGNAAHGQLQTDVFGELMDALYQARKGGIAENEAAWALERALIDHLETIWSKPDHGLWEIRSARRNFTYSRIMAWVAVDRCIRSTEEFGLAGPVERWRTLRDAIYEDVCTNGYDAARNTFVQSYGAAPLDASLLLIPTLGFLPASDPRFRGTVEAIEKELKVDGLVRRYNTEESDDGIAGHEGAFLACSFWLADAYAMIGRRDDAEAMFEHLLDIRNDLGLLAEEYDPGARCHLGNFPQAFSHLALIRTAQRLAHVSQPEERKPADAPK
jgi:GH15 family glucan-1,4-alpha-glucosidase